MNHLILSIKVQVFHDPCYMYYMSIGSYNIDHIISNIASNFACVNDRIPYMLKGSKRVICLFYFRIFIKVEKSINIMMTCFKKLAN